MLDVKKTNEFQYAATRQQKGLRSRFHFGSLRRKKGEPLPYGSLTGLYGGSSIMLLLDLNESESDR